MMSNRIEIAGQPNPVQRPNGPMRLRQIAGIVLLVLLLSGIGSGGWWYFHRDRPPTDEVLVDITHADTFGGGLGRRLNGLALATRGAPAPPTDPTAIQNQNVFRVANARLFINRVGSTTEWRMRFGYQPSLMAAEQSAIVLARWNSQALKLSPDQTKRLEALPAFNDRMVVSDDDQAVLKKQWSALIAAQPSARPAMRTAIESTLAEIAKRSEPATRAAIEDRIRKVESILTSDQLAKLGKK